MNDTWELLEHLCNDFNQDPYPESTLTGEGVYYRLDSIVDDVLVLSDEDIIIGSLSITEGV